MENGRDGQAELKRLLRMLSLSLAGGALLLCVRAVLTGRLYYFFLLWNLALAFVPYALSVAMELMAAGREAKRGGLLILATAALWFAFYPNAPYLFTDFIHLVNRTWLRGRMEVLDKDTLLWFDLMVSSLFAYLGHAVGLLSIDGVLRALTRAFGPRRARCFVGGAIAFAGLGLYIGRFVRFNTWDLLLAPVDTASAVAPHLDEPRTMLLSAVFSAFILITYLVHRIAHRR